MSISLISPKVEGEGEEDECLEAAAKEKGPFFYPRPKPMQLKVRRGEKGASSSLLFLDCPVTRSLLERCFAHKDKAKFINVSWFWGPKRRRKGTFQSPEGMPHSCFKRRREEEECAGLGTRYLCIVKG